jgi:hypothetical protein
MEESPGSRLTIANTFALEQSLFQLVPTQIFSPNSMKKALANYGM